MTGGTCFGSSLMQCTMVGFANFPSGGFTKIIQMTEGTCFWSSLMHCTLVGLTSFPSGGFTRLYKWQWGIWQCIGLLLMQCTVVGLTKFLSSTFTIASQSTGRETSKFYLCAEVMLMLQLWSWYLKLETMVTAAHCPFLFGIKSITKVRSLLELSCFQNCGDFQYNISWPCFDVSWCGVENVHNFETNENRATVF